MFHCLSSLNFSDSKYARTHGMNYNGIQIQSRRERIQTGERLAGARAGKTFDQLFGIIDVDNIQIENQNTPYGSVDIKTGFS